MTLDSAVKIPPTQSVFTCGDPIIAPTQFGFTRGASVIVPTLSVFNQGVSSLCVSVLAHSQCMFTRGLSPLCAPVLPPVITTATLPYYNWGWPTYTTSPAVTPTLLYGVNT